MEVEVLDLAISGRYVALTSWPVALGQSEFCQVRARGSGRRKKVAHFVWESDSCTVHPHSKPCPWQHFSRTWTIAPRPAAQVGSESMCRGEPGQSTGRGDGR
jgi:hypothetical protein